jgi:azurin
MRAISSFLFLSIVLVSACDKKEADSHQGAGSPAASAPPTPPPASAVVPAAPVPTASAKPAQRVEIEIASVANTMTFDKAKLSVPAGADVHLKIKNNSTMATLPHNWVLVKKGTEASVAAAGLKLGEPAGYVDIRDKDVLVHTPLAKPGETTDVEFTAPDPGDYPYICTVPGHYLMMKGVLTVTP